MLRLTPFRYLVPRTLAEALDRKRENGEAAVFVAGGTDLYPHIKRGLQAPAIVIPLRHLPELAGVTVERDVLRLGAGVTLAALAADSEVERTCPALSRAAGEVATPVIRGMATFGGNLCLDTRCNFYDQSHHWRRAVDFCLKKDGSVCQVAPSSTRCLAVQASDTAPVVVAAGASIEVAGPRGARTIPAADFFAPDGIRFLAKAGDEVVTAVRVPCPPGATASYTKVRVRGSFDFAVLSIAAWIRREPPPGGPADERWLASAPVQEARLVLGAVDSAPLVVEEAAELLVGRPLDVEGVRACADAAWRRARPRDNTDRSASWRKAMVRTYVDRALRQLARLPAADGRNGVR